MGNIGGQKNTRNRIIRFNLEGAATITEIALTEVTLLALLVCARNFANIPLVTYQGMGTWLSSELRKVKAVRKMIASLQLHRYWHKLAL